MQVRDTVSDADAGAVLNVSVPVVVPECFGLHATSTVHELGGLTWVSQVLPVITNPEVTEIPPWPGGNEIWPPLGVAVTVCDALVEPTEEVKLRLVGETVSVGAACAGFA